MLVLGATKQRQVVRDREPVYQGKRLSVWLREASMGSENQSFAVWLPEASANPAAHLRACQAVRQFGTNATPTLLEMVRQKDSSLVSKLIAPAHPEARELRVFYIAGKEPWARIGEEASDVRLIFAPGRCPAMT
jgi:hypothetical protein